MQRSPLVPLALAAAAVLALPSPARAQCKTATVGAWQNTSFASQSTSFTAEMDATAASDAAVGLSLGAQTAWSGLATIVRFNTTGTIDARNGGAYAATATVSYTAGTSYHVRFVVNVATHTYAAYVRPSGGSETQIASAYGFRTEQATVTSLNNWVAATDGGALTVCNFVLTPPDTTAPTVSMTAPAAGATVSGTIPVSANASDNVAVAGVQFLVDGANAGAEDTTAPFSISYNTAALASGSHSFSARARDAAGNTATAAAVTVTVTNVECYTATAGGGWVNDPFDVAQTGSFTATFDARPSVGSIDSVVGISNGPQTTYPGFACLARFNASGNIDARNGGAYAAAATIPYAGNNTYHFRLVVNIPAHTYSIYVTPPAGTEQTVGLNYAFRTEQAAVTTLSSWATEVDGPAGTDQVCGFTVTPIDTTPPTVTMTAPTAGATVAGTITVSASASDNVGVAGVQFLVDGANAGAEDTTAPYSISYNTAALTNGSHTFAARARDGAGNSTTSPGITVTVSNGDAVPPTVSMTAPSAGATVSGTITISANASDNVGVAGVQFLADGANIGTEDTSSPYSISYNTTALGNGSHAFSARARDAAGNTTTAAAVTVTVSNAAVSGHPRIWLDAATLTSLRQKAQAGSPQWTALRNTCNSYIPGTVQYPDGNDYPNLPNIGEGYQGSDYFDPLLNVALCYQIGFGIGDLNTSDWGAKGADILEKMSNPAHVPPYNRDDGYGIRFFGVGMAVGYDWLYNVLSPSLRAQVYGQLNNWISFFDTGGFGHGHPHGNYFAGYYAAKAYAGIATEGDNANAGTLWNDFLSRLHRGGPGSLVAETGSHTGVQAYYNSFLAGGGWSEGWGYGPVANVNMVLPSLAAKTAKSIDLIQDPAQPFSYPLDTGLHLIHFTWPSRRYMDDRDTLHTNGNDPSQSFPARPSTTLFTTTAGLLGKWNNALAPQYHLYAREVRAQVGLPAPWTDFLFWDDAASEQAYTTLARSFFARGLNTAAMRSDWGTSAVWGSFRATGYVDYDYAGEQDFDAGALAIVRGGTPFLVNKNFLAMTWPGTVNDESASYDEIWGSGTPRRIYNTFYNGTAGGQVGPPVDESPVPTTRISRYEDRNGYVLVRGSGLQDAYRGTSGVTSWTRDVVYLRPSLFVTFDRTVVTSTTGDQHMNWHFVPTPASVTAPSSGARRYDVTSASAGFVGAMTTLLPASAAVSTVNVFNFNKLYRLEVRPPTPATTSQWLTVFDASASAGAVALASRLTAADGNASANVTGALLRGTSNYAALFGSGPATATISGTVTFTVPAAPTLVVVTDLAPSAGYSATASAAGGNLTVTVQPGSGFTTSANGALYVNVSSSGTVTAGN